MDPGSTLLSTDYEISTTSDLTKTFELLESNSQLSNYKSKSNISLADLIDAAVSELKPMESKFPNLKGNTCQIISILESDEYDSDEILSLDSLQENEEEIPLELEISLLSDDSKEPLFENDVYPSTSANMVAPDVYSSNMVAPDVYSSNMVAPDVYSSNMVAPDVYSSNMVAPDVYSSNMVAPDVYSSNMVAPDVYSSNMVAPDVYSSNLEAPDVYSSNLEAPDVYSSNLEAPDVYSSNLEAPDVYSSNLVAPDVYSSNLVAPPSPTTESSSLDPNNNFSHKKQTLTGSDDGTFLLEDKEQSQTLIHVKSEQKVCKSVSPKRDLVSERQGFSCADSSNKILLEPYSPSQNINGYSDSMQNDSIQNCNILETTGSSDKCDFFKDITIGKEKRVWSESLHKSDLSKSILSEIAAILKDCNENVLDLEFGKDILSLESSDVEKNVETSNFTKTDLHNPQAGLKTRSKENSQLDPCSDRSLSEPCMSLQSRDRSGLNFLLDVMEENCQPIPKDCSSPCPLLKSKNSQCFVSAQDFKTKPTGNKSCQALPQNLIVITTLDGDKINNLSDNTATSSPQNHDGSSVHVSLGVKSQMTGKNLLKQRPQNFIHTKPIKCSSQYEDSVSAKDLKDPSKMNKPTISIAEETSPEHSGNFSVTKSYSLDVKKYSLEQSVIKDGKSLTNRWDIPKVNPGNLPKDSKTPERTSLTCQDFVSSTSDSQLRDYQNKSIQMVPLLSMQKPLINNLQGQSSQVDNQFRSLNYKASTFGYTLLNSSVKRQCVVENCTKEKTEESERSQKSISQSSCAKTHPKVKEEFQLRISVSNDCGNQKRIVKLENEFKREDEVLASHRNWQGSNFLNDDNQSMTRKNKHDQELQIKTTRNSDTNCRNLSGIDYVSKNIVHLKDVSKNLSNNSKPVNTHPVPTKCSTQTCNTATLKPIPNTALNNATTTRNAGAVPASIARSQLADRKTFGKNIKEIAQKPPVQPSKVSEGVKKKKKSKSAKKRARTLLALSEARNLSAQALVGTINTKPVYTKCRSQDSNTATSKLIQKTASSNSSFQQQQHCSKDVTVMAEDPMSKRKFVKAKRVWDKQKQLCSLLEGEDCLDECKINDRVQWVRRRWDVKTLSNQDLNLTSAAYIRRQLPTQTASCFQGCLEGQKDYTLAIVAPNRKRKLYEDDDYSTEDSDSLGRATKKRRLSRDVQLMPNDIKDLQPNMKLFKNQLIEKLAANRNTSLTALNRQRNEEMNVLNEHYYYLLSNLKQKYNQNRLFYGYMSVYQLQCDYYYQHQQLDFELQNRQERVRRNFAGEEERIHTQYKMNVDKIKTVLSEDISDSNCLTVALRKGPSRTSNYKITYQNVNLTSHVALAIIREDEIYDSFYSHNV